MHENVFDIILLTAFRSLLVDKKSSNKITMESYKKQNLI